MMSIVRSACMALLVTVPFATSTALAPDDVASAACRQQDRQLTLMQVHARARQLMNVKSHHDADVPTLQQIQDAFDTFVQTLQGISEDMNNTLTGALTTGESSMRRVSDFLEVAETSADSVAGIWGQTGSPIVEKLTCLSNKVQEQIHTFVSESESFRQQLQDSLQSIYDIITGQGNATITKMETASDDVEAAGNTSSASLMQLQATLSGLQKAVQTGCLSKADTEAILHMHGRDSLVAHFQEVDSNGDGCIRMEELEQSVKQLDTPFHREADAVSLLMFRAAAGHHLSSSSALEEAVARKGASKDPCSVATSALTAANSSLPQLEAKLEGVNESMVELMEQGIQLLEASVRTINSTVVAGLDAAVQAGLLSHMTDPVVDALNVMMSGFDTGATAVRDAEASVSNALVDAVGSFTPTFVHYIDGIAARLSLVCV